MNTALHQLFLNVSCIILLSAHLFSMYEFDLHLPHLLVVDIRATFIHQHVFLVYLQKQVSVFPLTLEDLEKSLPVL